MLSYDLLIPLLFLSKKVFLRFLGFIDRVFLENGGNVIWFISPFKPLEVSRSL